MTDEKQPKQQDEQQEEQADLELEEEQTDEVKGGGRLRFRCAPTRSQQVQRLSRAQRRAHGGYPAPSLVASEHTGAQRSGGGGNALDRTLFRAGERCHTWRDVVRLAQLRSDWDAIAEQACSGLAALEELERHGEAPLDEVEAAARAARPAGALCVRARPAAQS